MSATTADVQVRTYLDALRAHLDDLPEEDRNELLEDLEAHLLEVAAEDDGPLEQRLGPPAAYAEELRASAGLPSKDQVAARGTARRLSDRFSSSAAWRAGSTIAESPRFRALRAFLEECRPGWWVARGYLAIVALAQITGGTGTDDVPFPSVLGSFVTGVLLAIAAVFLSVWLGRRAQRRRKGRLVSTTLSIGVAILASMLLAGWSPSYAGTRSYYESGYGPEPVPYLHHADGSKIANICPYSADGKPLSGVLLFDQDGRAIGNVADTLPDGRPWRMTQPAILNAYPHELEVPNELGEPVPLACPPSVGAVPAPPPSGGAVVPTPAKTP